MSYYLSPAGVMVQQLTNAGLPLSGGKVYIYSAGTVTPINSYTDSTGVTLNANPIILNSAGRLPNSIWIASNTAHKMVLKDATGNTLSTIDSMYGINDPYNLNATINNLPTGGGTANAQTITNTTVLNALTNGLLQWYVASTTNTGATTLNVDSLGAKNIFSNGLALTGGEIQSGLVYLLKYDGTQWNLINPVTTGVSSVTAMRLIKGFVNGQPLRLTGYYTEGDGGGGEFFWNATSTTADNGGTIIAPTGVSIGRWYRIYSGAVNVKWFGAKGDGVTDARLAIQNAVNACNAAGGGDVFVPQGTFLIAGTQATLSGPSRLADGVIPKENVRVIGSGSASIITTDAVGAYAFSTHFQAVINTDTGNLHNVAFEKLKFTKPVKTFFQYSQHINIESVNNLKIKDCTFVNWSGDAIKIGGTDDSLLSTWLQGIVQDVEISGCIFDGVDNNNRNCITIFTGTDILIHDNEFKNSTTSLMPGAIDIEPELTWPVLSNITIHNNTFENIGGDAGVISVALGAALATQPTNIIISGNSILNCVNTYQIMAIGQSGTPTTLPASAPTGIYIKNNVIKGASNKLYNLNGCYNMVFCGNMVDGFADQSFYGDTNNPIIGLEFTSNVFRNGKIISSTAGYSFCRLLGNVVGGDISRNVWVNVGIWTNAATPSYMTILNAAAGGLDTSNLMVLDNIISAGSTAFNSASEVFYNSAAFTTPSTIIIGRNTSIGSSLYQGLPYSWYKQCLVVGTEGIVAEYRDMSAANNGFNLQGAFDDTKLPDSFLMGMQISHVANLTIASGEAMIINIKTAAPPASRYANIQFAVGLNTPKLLFMRRPNTTTNTWAAWTTITGT